MLGQGVRSFTALAVVLLGAPVAIPAQTEVYVANLGSDSVSVIDAGTNERIASVPVGDDPDGIVAPANAEAIFVTGFLSDDVSVLDHQSLDVVATIPVGSGPVGIAAAPDGGLLYTANRGSGTVSVIDAALRRVIATIPVDEGPNGIAVSPDGRLVYVTNSFTHSPGVVSVIDTALNRVVNAVAVNHSPGRVAFTPDASFAYVTNYRSGNVSVIDTVTAAVVTTVPVFGKPSGVVVNPNGAFVYVTTLGGRVNVISTSDHSLVANVAVGGTPYAIAIAPNGELGFATNFWESTLAIVNVLDHVSLQVIDVENKPFAVAVRCSPAACAGTPVPPRPTRTPTATLSPRPTSTAAPTSTPLPSPVPIVVSVGSAAPDASGRVLIDVTLEGFGVGGFQNDIVFDGTVLELVGCTINPVIGLFPLGPAASLTCFDDPSIGPCKNLSRTLDRCDTDPLPQGCPPGQPMAVRSRAIIAATAAPNNNAIPPGTSYTCAFDVMRPEALPVELASSNVVVSDPFGLRLDSEAQSGVVLTGDTDDSPAASSAQPASSGSSSAGCTLIGESEKRSALPYLFGALLLLVGSVVRR